MYRQYESPHRVQELLDEARARLERYYQDLEFDQDAIIDMHNEIADLEERLNFAWQDAEYDEEVC